MTAIPCDKDRVLWEPRNGTHNSDTEVPEGSLEFSRLWNERAFQADQRPCESREATERGRKRKGKSSDHTMKWTLK